MASARGPAGEAPPEGLDLGDDLVTGEAVVLALRPASFAVRALALALDLVVVGIAGLLALWVFVAFSLTLDDAAASAVVLVVIVGVLVGLPVTIETLTRGRSLGKLAAGLRVVRDDGGPIRFRHALIRGLLAMVEIYVASGSIALIASLSNARGKRLGDMLAGTYVVRERTAAATLPPAHMPPELAAWAAGSDIGRIPDRLAAACRQLLGRVHQINPTSRARLGSALAAQLAAHVSPPPPPGTHPERFIAAVLAERRDRDLRRLLREASARRDRDARRRGASPLSPTGTGLLGGDR